MTRYGKGYVRDVHARRLQKSSRELLGGAPAFPDEASLQQFEAPILDQGMTGSCTGHGTAQGIYVSFAAAGQPLPWVPSPAGIYTLGRCIERARTGGGGDLTDEGAMPADVMEGISRWGVRPIQAPTSDGRFSDVTPRDVNDEPQLGDLETDALRLVVGEYRIDETADDVVDQVCAAIAAGIPVGVGIFVDRAFENWMPGQPPIGAPNERDPEGGGHWVVLTAYTTDAKGSRVFRVVNSWGDTWADAGTALVSEAWAKKAFDLYVLDVARAK